MLIVDVPDSIYKPSDRDGLPVSALQHDECVYLLSAIQFLGTETVMLR
jgi:hypothetical protein